MISFWVMKDVAMERGLKRISESALSNSLGVVANNMFGYIYVCDRFKAVSRSLDGSNTFQRSDANRTFSFHYQVGLSAFFVAVVRVCPRG